MKKLILVLLIVCIGSVAFAKDVDKKHRIGAYVGYFVPTGEYEEPDITLDFDGGVNMGVEYTYSINQFFGIGAFLERTSFSTEEKTINILGTAVDVGLDITSTIFGVSGVFTYHMEQAVLYGGGKLGLCDNTRKIKVSAGGISTSEEETGSEFVFILEGGGRYSASDLIDISLGLKYTVNSQKVEDAEDDIDLGGLALMAGIGFNF